MLKESRLDSPSKAERLFNLKKRAEDRRAQSAGTFGSRSEFGVSEEPNRPPTLTASTMLGTFTLGTPLRSTRILGTAPAVNPAEPRVKAALNPHINTHAWGGKADYWAADDDDCASSPTIAAARTKPPFPSPSPMRRGLPAARTAGVGGDSADSRGVVGGGDSPIKSTTSAVAAGGLYSSDTGSAPEIAQSDLQPCANPDAMLKQCLVVRIFKRGE